MDQALAAADLAGFPARRAEARARGRYRGLGHAVYIEQSGFPPDEFAELRFDPSGTLTILMGTQSSGQGHQTAYAQLAAERLGIAARQDPRAAGRHRGDRVWPRHRRLALDAGRRRGARPGRRQADRQGPAASPRICSRRPRPTSNSPTASSRSPAPTAGSASRRWRAPPSTRRGRRPGVEPGFDESGHFTPPQPTFPNGCHVCEVEIDPETGHIEIVRYLVVDDFGTVINPLLLAGQVHGGIAQGVGQAMLERTVFDPETGQLLTGSLTDYCIAARRGPAGDRVRLQCRAVPHQPARRQGRRRGRRDRRAAGAGQRRRRRARRARHRASRHAADPGAAVARDPRAPSSGKRHERRPSRNCSTSRCARRSPPARRSSRSMPRRSTSRHKTDKTPVTEADLASERIIVDDAEPAFPDIPIVSEELAEAEGMPPCCAASGRRPARRHQGVRRPERRVRGADRA